MFCDHTNQNPPDQRGEGPSALSIFRFQTRTGQHSSPTSPAAAPDVYEVLLKEERMLHSDKHVAGITFRFTLLFYEIYKSSLLLISHLTESKK